MGVLTRAEKRRLKEGAASPTTSSATSCPFSPPKILSSRWRHLWRSAPLNLDRVDHNVRASVISHILSVHPVPCRFVMPLHYAGNDCPTAATIDGWLCSPALDNLQELMFYHYPPLPLPPSVSRFSSTLRVCSFCWCVFPDGNNGGAPQLFPVLESLTLSTVSISESALHALLAGCPALQSFVLICTNFVSCSRLQKIVSPSLRSIMVSSYFRRFELVIEDAPCLERIQCSANTRMTISVISAPRLAILGELCDKTPRLQFGTTVLQGSTVVSMAAAVHNVTILYLSGVKLCLDAAIELLKCFPNLEELHIKATSSVCVENGWYQMTNQECIRTLNIRVRKIVLKNYQGSRSHVNFVNFFLSNAKALESVELVVRNITTNKWIARQHRLLSIKTASRDAQVTFVCHKKKLKTSRSARDST